MNELRIGLLGLGTVGGGVVKLLRENGDLFAQRSGLRPCLVRIATRHPGNRSDLDLTGISISDNPDDVVDAVDVDVVVELMGGIHPAYTLVKRALSCGKHVVTANKALLAESGNELLALAGQTGCELAFEASVAGAVPIIKALRESLSANRIQQLFGILNGTCNFILTEMRERGLPFGQVLADAQAKGYAEADPSFDVDGIDAAHKLSILAAIAFGIPIDFSKVSVEGIRGVSDVDIAWASEMGFRIKLLGIAKQSAKGIELRVQPTLVPVESMVAKVEGVFNAVFVQGDFSGTTMFFGRGAGEKPTASAVVADLIEIARHRHAQIKGNRVSGLSTLLEYVKPGTICTLDDLQGEYYLRLSVQDRPGVLSEVTQIFARHQISINAIHQKGRSSHTAVPLVLVTHETSEKQIQASLKEIRQLKSVQEKPQLIRIENIIE
ncbi:MAG: homoserine dehydrogenase [Magnetococcus sp. DMHC-6]